MRGLALPRDLSVLTLNPSNDAAWMKPRPAGYSIQQDFLLQSVRRWRQGKATSGDQATRAVIEAWDPGETVGRAPAEPAR